MNLLQARVKLPFNEVTVQPPGGRPLLLLLNQRETFLLIRNLREAASTLERGIR